MGGVEQLLVSQSALGSSAGRRAERRFSSGADDTPRRRFIRTWSTWNRFFAHKVAEPSSRTTPMESVRKPPRPTAPVEVIRGPDATSRLLEAAGGPIPGSPALTQGGSCPDGHLRGTELRLAEALSFTMGSFNGSAGERRITIV